MFDRSWINKFSWRVFYPLFVLFNAFLIEVFATLEIRINFAQAFFLIISAVSLNLAFILAYCHEGRSSLKKIPFIAATFAVTYSVAGMLLGEPKFAVPILEHIYRIAQLFVGESAWIDPIIQRQAESAFSNTLAAAFNLARIVALLATVSGVLAVVRGLADWISVSVPPWKWDKHTVLCGLGEAGMEFVKIVYEDTSHESRKAVGSLLVIESDESNPNVESARNLGAAVLLGDVFNKTVQAKARIEKATTVIMMLPDDKRNIELALELREWIKRRHRTVRSPIRRILLFLKDCVPQKFPQRRRIVGWLERLAHRSRPTVKLLIHVDETRLARRLQDHSRAGAEEYTETRFFDFYESSARALFEKYPLDYYADVQRADSVHLAIYGFGQMGEAVLRQAVRQACFPDGRTLHISIFDRRVDEDGFVEGFWRANPGLRALQKGDGGYRPMPFSLRFLKLIDAHCGMKLKRLYECVLEDILPPTQHVICFDLDSLGAGFAMSLRDMLRDRTPLEIQGRPYSWDAPIFVRLQRRNGLARLFLGAETAEEQQSKNAPQTPDSLFAFGMLDDIVEARELIGAHRDGLAKILHEDGYRKLRRIHGAQASANIWRKQTQVPWESLPLHFKSSSRAQADHIVVKLRSVGCTVGQPSITCDGFSLARTGAACFEPVDRIFRSNGKFVTVQRLRTQLPVVTCWEPAGAAKDRRDPEQIPEDVISLDAQAKSEGTNRTAKPPKRWRNKQTKIRALQKDLGLPALIGPRDPILNRDLGDDVSMRPISTAKNSHELALYHINDAKGRLETQGFRQAEVIRSEVAWPWLAALVQEENTPFGKSSEPKAEGEEESGNPVTLFLWRLSSEAWSTPLKPVRRGGFQNDEVDSDSVELLLATNLDTSVCAVTVWPGGAPAEMSEQTAREAGSKGGSHVWLTGTKKENLPGFSKNGLSGYKPVAFQFSSDDRQLMLALQDKAKDSADDRETDSTTVLINHWELDVKGTPLEEEAPLRLHKGQLPISAKNVSFIEVAIGRSGEPLVLAATKANHIFVLNQSAQFIRIDARLHSGVTTLTIFDGCSVSPATAPDENTTTLAVGCQDSDTLLIGLDFSVVDMAEFGDSVDPVSIIQLAHPWMAHLRKTRIEDDHRPDFIPDRDAWERLARIEHDRWAAFNYLENWRYGKPRVDVARVHDNLIPWKKLDANIKQYDATHVAKIPLFLDRLSREHEDGAAKTQLCREIRIGIVGHRPHRLKSHLAFLNYCPEKGNYLPSGKDLDRDKIDNLVDLLLEKFPMDPTDLPVKFVLVTCLAEGADRVLAQALLDHDGLNAELQTVLPLPWEIYYNTFATGPGLKDQPTAAKHSVDQFLGLIEHKKARGHIQMPMLYGSSEKIADSETKLGEVSPQQKQFQLANAWIAQRCDYLIAAWDGKEIGGNPAALSHGGLKEKLRDLPDAGKESSYTEDAKPGGTWETVRWWLDPAAIPESMQWPSHWNPICADNERAPEDRLFLIGAGVTAEGMNAGEEQ